MQEFNLAASPDSWIVMQALKTKSVIVTKDADFSNAAILSLGCQVVWLRIGNATVSHLLKKLELTISEIEQSLEDGQTIIEVLE